MMSISEDCNGEQSTSTKLQREQIIIITTIIMMIIDNFCILLFSGLHKLIALYNILRYFIH